MADFKTHLRFGAFLGTLLSVVLYFVDFVHNIYMAIIIYFSVIVGSFLPDVDSDSGTPVRIIFEFYAYLAAALTVFFLHNHGFGFFMWLTGAVLVFLMIRVVLMNIFMKYSRHRGIFHSFPAFLSVFLLVLFVTGYTDLTVKEKFSLSIAVALGYFGHLLLDEIYSVKLVNPADKKEVDESNIRTFKEIWQRHFGVKKSFGTALDFGFHQEEKYPAIIIYSLIFVFLLLDYPLLKEIFDILF